MGAQKHVDHAGEGRLQSPIICQLWTLYSSPSFLVFSTMAA